MNKEYKLVSLVYKFSIIVLIVYLALNILIQLLPGSICRISDVIHLLNFPCLYIFLTILFLWPIHLRHKKASETQANQEESYLIILKALCLLIFSASLFIQFILLFVPILFYLYQLMILIVFAIIFPFHVYSNLIRQRNHPFLMCAAVGILPIIIGLALNFSAAKFHILVIPFIGVVIIWNLYIIGLWQNPQPKLFTAVNYYNPFNNQVFPNSYRSNFMQMMRLSGLANLLFLTYAYLSLICENPLELF